MERVQEPLESVSRTTKYDNIQRLAVEVVLSSTRAIAYWIYGIVTPKVKLSEAFVSYLKSTLEIIEW